MPCKNEGNDSQSASQCTIKINGWFAKHFYILAWTAAVLLGARKHFIRVLCFHHQIKQSTCHLVIPTRKRECPVESGEGSRLPAQHCLSRPSLSGNGGGGGAVLGLEGDRTPLSLPYLLCAHGQMPRVKGGFDIKAPGFTGLMLRPH